MHKCYAEIMPGDVVVLQNALFKDVKGRLGGAYGEEVSGARGAGCGDYWGVWEEEDEGEGVSCESARRASGERISLFLSAVQVLMVLDRL